MENTCNRAPIDMIIAATAVVEGVRLAVLMSRTRSPAGRARRIAQVAALQAGHPPTAVGDAFGRDRSTVTGRPGGVDAVGLRYRDTIAAILEQAAEFTAMPREQVDRIVGNVGRVALPPDIAGASRRVVLPSRVSAPRGALLRAVS